MLTGRAIIKLACAVVLAVALSGAIAGGDLALSGPAVPLAIGHISNGSGNPETDIRPIDFGGGLKTRFRADEIRPGTREVVAITVGLCDGGTLANTSATILVPIAGAPPSIAGGLGAIPCVPSAFTDPLRTGINGAVLTFAGPLARFMSTVRMYADIDFDGRLFEAGELVAQGVPIFNEGTSEAILQFGRQGQMLMTATGAPLSVPNATPVPLLIIFTVDLDSTSPGGRVEVALGLGVGDDTAQGAGGICAVRFGTNCGSNLMRTGPETSSFTVVGSGGGTVTPPPPPPPSGGSSPLKQYDTNNNDLVDDQEFFTIIDAWIAGSLDDTNFFKAIDLWVSQSRISSAGFPTRPRVSAEPSPSAVAFTAHGQEVSALRVEVFSLSGRQLFERETAGNRLVWHLTADDGRPAANGIYLYRVTVRGHDGQIIRTEIRKLLVLK